mgnify:CR=1 FL=1
MVDVSNEFSGNQILNEKGFEMLNEIGFETLIDYGIPYHIKTHIKSRFNSPCNKSCVQKLRKWIWGLLKMTKDKICYFTGSYLFIYWLCSCTLIRNSKFQQSKKNLGRYFMAAITEHPGQKALSARIQQLYIQTFV